MTNKFKYFHTYVSYPNNKKIVTEDDSLNVITDKGSIKLRRTFILEDALYALKLCANLVSVCKLSQVLNCKVIFNSSHYGFYD